MISLRGKRLCFWLWSNCVTSSALVCKTLNVHANFSLRSAWPSSENSLQNPTPTSVLYICPYLHTYACNGIIYELYTPGTKFSSKCLLVNTHSGLCLKANAIFNSPFQAWIESAEPSVSEKFWLSQTDLLQLATLTCPEHVRGCKFRCSHSSWPGR